MPLKRLLSLNSTQLNQPSPKKAKKRKVVTHFTQFEKIGYTPDQWHSVLRCIPNREDELKKVIYHHVGSFLNCRGGILCFGVRPNGTIYGDEVSRKDEDLLRLVIDRCIKFMHPFVDPTMYRVTFTPVMCSSSSTSSRPPLFVVEIRVNHGIRTHVYEDEFHEVYTRDENGIPYGPLTPHEIKAHLYKRFCQYGLEQLRSQPTTSEVAASTAVLQAVVKPIISKKQETSSSASTSSISCSSSSSSSSSSSEPKNTQADSPRKEEIITPTNKCKETICSPILPPLTSKHSSKQSQQSYTASTTMSSSKPPQLVMPPRVPPHPSSYVNFPPSSYTLRPPSYYYRY